MDSVELYRQLPGLAVPWTVERAELDVARQQVDVRVCHTPGQRFARPGCGREPGGYDHLPERGRRHPGQLPIPHLPACANPNHFRIAVYFHCSGLDLHPAAVTRTKVG